MRINLDPNAEPEMEYFAYEQEPTLELLITRVTPPIEGKAIKAATTRPPMLNGRMRRQMPTPEFDHSVYQRTIFLECVKGWRFTNTGDEPCPLIDEHGRPIPYSEDAKKAVALQHKGLVEFGFDVATMLGEISAEQVRDERAAFRGAPKISSQLAQPEL